MGLGFVLVILILCALGPTHASASDRPIYAIVIGNNAAPTTDASLPALQFADDDASRFHGVLQRAGAEVSLLTVLDERSQARFPGLADIASLPTRENLSRAFESVRTRIVEDVAHGKRPVVFVTFSGHGAFGEEGEPFLALFDGNLTRSELFTRHLAGLRDVRAHLIVDACHAGAMVGVRGPFAREREASPATLDAEETRRLDDSDLLEAYPNVGVIAAASSNQEAHEWSKIESGVFTHEVLSALLGAADVNQDKRIEYSEVQAFVSAANRGVGDVRARTRIVARAPSADRHAVLMDLRDFRAVTFLEGMPGSLGHFQIEVDGTGAWLDAHPARDAFVSLAIPLGERAFLRAGGSEVSLPTQAPTISFSALRLQPLQSQPRGVVDASLRQSLFATPFGRAYYAGFVDSADLSSVNFADAPERRDPTRRSSFASRRGIAIASLSVAGAAGVASVVFGALALERKGRFEDTDIMSEAHELEQDVRRFRTVAIATAAVAASAGVATYFVWPRVDPKSGSVVGVFTGRF
jgi:hypothetical protein